MERVDEKVMALLEDGYHCSQVMMELSLEARGIENPLLLRAMGGLGGGLFSRGVCGTLTGAAAAIGSYFPRGEGEGEPRGYQAPVKQLVTWFEAEFGSLECRDLVDTRKENFLTFCPRLMARTHEKVQELLTEYGIDPYE